MEFQKWYVEQFGWVATFIDWKHWHNELHRLAEVDNRRMLWWASGAAASSAEIPESAKTGYKLLDMRVPPTRVGRAMRKLGLAISSKSAHWEVDHDRRRRLNEAVWARHPLGDTRSITKVVTDPETWQNFEGSTNGIIEFLERRDHRTRLRNLSKAVQGVRQLYFSGWRGRLQLWVGSSSSVQGPWSSSDEQGVFSAPQEAMNSFEVVLRYFVFNVALCYL